MTGSGASVPLKVRIGAAVTPVVMTVPATADVSLLSMLYEPFVMVVPFARGLATRTTICTEPEDEIGSVPMFQVTTPPESVPPRVAETNVVFAGTVSVMTTPVASAVPPFA